MIARIIDAVKGKAPLSAKRSGHWSTVRKEHLEKHGACALCEGKDKLNVHHIKPFHLHPELELEPSNLITLCESEKGGVNCHLFFGHLGNFKSVNETVVEDVEKWKEKVKNRPE
jgi:hypothetical protein